MGLTDPQVDAQIAQMMAGYDGRILIAQLAATTLGVELRAAIALGDTTHAYNLSQQILSTQRDIAVLTAANTELAKIGGKLDSGRKAKVAAETAVADAQAFVAIHAPAPEPDPVSPLPR